jgi:hypothetical protein
VVCLPIYFPITEKLLVAAAENRCQSNVGRGEIMQLKMAILHSMARDDLKQIVDDLNLDGVDRRSVEAIRVALGRSRRLTLEDLLGRLRKDALQAMCEELGLPARGKRDVLVQRLLGNGKSLAAK